MNLKTLFKIAAGTAVLGFGTAANALVYCPGNTAYSFLNPGYMNTTTTEAPLSGTTITPSGWNSYISSNQFADNRNCYWIEGNLDPDGWTDFNAGSTQFNYAGYAIKDVFDDPNDSNVNFGWSYNSTTGVGTWTITGFNVSASDPLYIGLHFGNGNDNPDSFIVQLTSLSGSFTFRSINSKNGKEGAGGLSNLYLFGSRCTNGDCETTEVPEPGSLALLGASLAGLALIRRRRRV